MPTGVYPRTEKHSFNEGINILIEKSISEVFQSFIKFAVSVKRITSLNIKIIIEVSTVQEPVVLRIIQITD